MKKNAQPIDPRFTALYEHLAGDETVYGTNVELARDSGCSDGEASRLIGIIADLAGAEFSRRNFRRTESGWNMTLAGCAFANAMIKAGKRLAGKHPHGYGAFVYPAYAAALESALTDVASVADWRGDFLFAAFNGLGNWCRFDFNRDFILAA